MMRVDIEKDNCAMCVAEYKPQKSNVPIYRFNIGVRRIHLCKRHFYEFMDTMIKFYEKDKEDEGDK